MMTRLDSIPRLNCSFLQVQPIKDLLELERFAGGSSNFVEELQTTKEMGSS